MISWFILPSLYYCPFYCSFLFSSICSAVSLSFVLFALHSKRRNTIPAVTRYSHYFCCLPRLFFFVRLRDARFSRFILFFSSFSILNKLSTEKCFPHLGHLNSSQTNNTLPRTEVSASLKSKKRPSEELMLTVLEYVTFSSRLLH